MTSTVLFVVMIIFSAILLLVASLYSTFGAENIFSSTTYNNDARARSAHQYLTIGAALGWCSIVVLIVILIVAAAAGGFTTLEVSELFLTKSYPTKEDLITAYKSEKILSSGEIMEIIVIFTLCIITIVTFIVGIFGIIAAVQIGQVTTQDDLSRAAYTNSIVAGSTAVGGVGVMVISILAYVSIRSVRQKQLEDVIQFEKRVEIVNKVK